MKVGTLFLFEHIIMS